ncbi:MAG: hypothetical protein J7M34_00340, partial [Anaerolineae bacterium]|nr:hypothetical protein [Anaerolineae bacterium]
MDDLLLKNPTPDFAEMRKVLEGEMEPRRVYLAELGIDQEVLQAITEQYLGQTWTPWNSRDEVIPPKEYVERLVTIYYRLGYDYVPTWCVWVNHPAPRRRRTSDTAVLARDEREWVDESRGLIGSWEEFEQFPWD